MRALTLVIASFAATAAFADTITLRDGRVINGTYLGGTSRQVRVETGDQIRTFDISEISRIDFFATAAEATAPAPAAAPAPARTAAPPAASASAPATSDRPVLRRSDNVMRPSGSTASSAAPAPAQTGPVELAAGTNIVIRMIDGVDSEINSVGQTFKASLDEPIMVNGSPLVPRGSDAVVRLVDEKDSGKLTGRSALTLHLVSLSVNGRPVDLNTQTVSLESESSRGARTAKTAAGVGAVGAIIGAIAGGGKGAAIGAAAGGAAGAGAVMLSGERVKIPSETRITFVLDSPIRL